MGRSTWWTVSPIRAASRDRGIRTRLKIEERYGVMNENGKKKREWVKTAAIVFLSVMLVLTFFSQTIMNYSLPEVATQYVSSGTITAKIRGSGAVESGDPYEVKVNQSRKVASVEVRSGDVVEKGTVLMYLEDAESEEMKTAQEALDAAKKELEKAQDAYSEALLKEEITSTNIYAANKGVSTDTYRRQINSFQALIKNLENEMKPLEEKKTEIERLIADFGAQESYEAGLDSAAEARVPTSKKAMENAEASKNSAERAHAAAQTAYDNAQKALEDAQHEASVSGGDAASKIPELTAKRDDMKRKLDEAAQHMANARQAYSNAVNDYNNAVNADNDRKGSSVHASLASQKAALEMELYNIQKQLDEKTKEKENREKELATLLKDITNVLGLGVFQDAIEDAQEKVAKAQEAVDEQSSKDIGATITAPISGTVTAVNVTSGNNTKPETPVVVMQPEGKGYTMSFSVTNEQAKRLSVGDQADLVNSWRYDDVTVMLASIKPDKNDPGQKKELTFDVTGSVTPGQMLNVSVGQKSANYDLIVPNSAIREDNNGKFILIVESKSSPLGTRYTASRVDVEVLASDDTQSAISGALYGYEFVITTSTKPVEAGKLVRLANN
jgi:multidrug efflux pump subunit AcrA (membrane-fusion protein)